MNLTQLLNDKQSISIEALKANLDMIAELAEQDPVSYIDQFEREVNEPLSLFKKQEHEDVYDDYVLCFYTDSVKMFLFIEQYKHRILNLLWKLYERDLNPNFESYLYRQLYKIYYLMRDTNSFSKDELLESSKYAIATYSKARNLFQDEIVLKHNIVTYSDSKPKHLKEDAIYSYTKEDHFAMLDAYQKLLTNGK